MYGIEHKKVVTFSSVKLVKLDAILLVKLLLLLALIDNFTYNNTFTCFTITCGYGWFIFKSLGTTFNIVTTCRSSTIYARVFCTKFW